MTAPDEHIRRARRLLARAAHNLSGGFAEGAGRDAYLAAFHAAQAFTVHRSGKQPKTHSGARSEFARLARDEPGLAQDFAAFLARGFDLKVIADYEGDEVVDPGLATAAMDVAARMVDAVAMLVGSERQSA